MARFFFGCEGAEIITGKGKGSPAESVERKLVCTYPLIENFPLNLFAMAAFPQLRLNANV